MKIKKALKALILPVVLLGAGAFLLRATAPGDETASISCRFKSIDEEGIRIPYSGATIERVLLDGDLRHKSVSSETKSERWQFEGVATFAGKEQNLVGSTHVSQKGKVNVLALSPDKSIREGTDFSIATLNENGGLDFDERRAYLFFGNSTLHTPNPLSFECEIEDSASFAFWD